MKQKHIILGAGGTISQVLTAILQSHHEPVKLVSRSGHSMQRAEVTKADLTDSDAVQAAVEQDSIVYLTAGLPYDRRIWETQWPIIMTNTINACRDKNAKLIFFDNVYAYGRVNGPMTEDTPINPCSAKGTIRAKIADQLLEETRKGNIKALIARAADFYGPYADKSSLPYLFVFSRLASGKKPQAMVNASAKHSYTYTGDCGKALYLLSRTDNAFGRVWHLPTARPALTTEEFIDLTARLMHASPGYSTMSKWMIKLAGLFDRQIKEVVEMLYQNEFEYIFDSTAFEKRFDYTPTPYEQGISETIMHFQLSAPKS